MDIKRQLLLAIYKKDVVGFPFSGATPSTCRKNEEINGNFSFIRERNKHYTKLTDIKLISFFFQSNIFPN